MDLYQIGAAAFGMLSCVNGILSVMLLDSNRRLLGQKPLTQAMRDRIVPTPLVRRVSVYPKR